MIVHCVNMIIIMQIVLHCCFDPILKFLLAELLYLYLSVFIELSGPHNVSLNLLLFCYLLPSAGGCCPCSRCSSCSSSGQSWPQPQQQFIYWRRGWWSDGWDECHPGTKVGNTSQIPEVDNKTYCYISFIKVSPLTNNHLKASIKYLETFYIRRKAANTGEKPPVKTQDNVMFCFSLEYFLKPSDK